MYQRLGLVRRRRCSCIVHPLEPSGSDAEHEGNGDADHLIRDQEKTEAIATMTNTMAVVIAVSRRDGQVTLRVSSRTCWRNLNGDVAIQCSLDLSVCSTSPNVVTATTLRRPADRRFSAEPEPGRSGRTRTCNPRFWRPVLWPLSYTPPKANAADHKGPPRRCHALYRRLKQGQKHRKQRIFRPAPKHSAKLKPGVSPCLLSELGWSCSHSRSLHGRAQR